MFRLHCLYQLRIRPGPCHELLEVRRVLFLGVGEKLIREIRGLETRVVRVLMPGVDHFADL